MKRRRTHARSTPDVARRIATMAAAGACVVLACAWEPWIPGERSWNPDIVVEPGDLSDQLPLDAPYVGKLDCYARSCEKRFRLVVDRPGQLAVSAVPELASSDDQMRVVLESVQGVLSRAGSGRGPREDVPVLTVTEAVDPGVYFVLVQSIGGPIPYQLTARLTPGAGPGPEMAARAAAPPAPTAQLVDISLPGDASGGYDPAVSFASLRTFAFGPRDATGYGEAGARVDLPIDRQIRRFLADDLTLRGFRQASGDETADLVVAFTQRATNRTLRMPSGLYDRDDIAPVDWGQGDAVATRGHLLVEIVDARSNRVAWRAWTTKPLGPGTRSEEAATALVREAVTEVLSGFPPR